MKSFKFIIAILLFLSFGTLSAQNISDAFSNKDYAAINSLLSPTVSVKIGTGEKASGAAKGLKLIEKVLSEFQPVRLESRHKGSSEGADSDYLIVKLFNAENEGLRIFIHLESKGDSKHICDVKMRKS